MESPGRWWRGEPPAGTFWTSDCLEGRNAGGEEEEEEEEESLNLPTYMYMYMYVYIHSTQTYMKDQSLRLGKAKQLRLKTAPFFSREKEELPQAGLEPATFCMYT